MNVIKKPSGLLILLLFLSVASCDDSNPLAPLTDENIDISVELDDSDTLSGNVLITNETDYNWVETDVKLTITEVATGEEHIRELSLSEVEVGQRKGAYVFSTQKVQQPLCYHYLLTVIPGGEGEKKKKKGGNCSE